MSAKNVRLICIGGSSGVGKTTIASMIQTIIGSKRSVWISGDDFHRWERGDPHWKKCTHLNPEANDLEDAWKTIARLVEGSAAVYHRRYCHETGKFGNFEVLFDLSDKVVIYEGLHALMDPPEDHPLREEWDRIPKFRIFVDANEPLKVKWKVERDTRSRGYTRDQVLKAIESRKPDEKKYIKPQSKNADQTVFFYEGLQYGVNALVTTRNPVHLVVPDSKRKVEDLLYDYPHFSDFVRLSLSVGRNPDLVQGAGGNISWKITKPWGKTGAYERMLIKSSGVCLEHTTMAGGFVLMDIVNGKKRIPKTDAEYDGVGASMTRGGSGVPSMEYGMHLVIPSKVVVHTHPIHLNAILCSVEGMKIVRKVLARSHHEMRLPCFPFPIQANETKCIRFVKPGLPLMRKVHEAVKKSAMVEGEVKIYLLENHGLIVSSESADIALDLTIKIEEWAKDALDAMRKESARRIRPDLYTVGCRPQNETGTIPPLFPDAAVFPSLSSVNEYIFRLLTGAGLTPKFLPNQAADEIKNLESEKRRRSMR
jgi:uridine kinase/ribulose-5-phosphate 4-epimerase/fuculose-1-phosphate aldolase